MKLSLLSLSARTSCRISSLCHNIRLFLLFICCLSFRRLPYCSCAMARVVSFFKMILLDIAILSAVTTATLQNNTVSLDYGSFRGSTNPNTGTTRFLGIQFAEPPVGEQRFSAPISPPLHNLDMVDATSFAPACVQANQPYVAPGFSEDCLYGNIFLSKETNSQSRHPVLVYFHGGGWQSGQTSDFPGELLLSSSDKPFVFATFAYRLGALGFLAGSEVKEHGNGNVGLFDQQAALRWIQRYIPYFGGDPSRVTIWGQSAGAGSIMFHLAHAQSSNEVLFAQAIADSIPFGYAPQMTDDYVERIYADYLKAADCQDIVCLRSSDSDHLARASAFVLANRTSSLFTFQPSIDGEYVKEHASVAFKAGRFLNVPTIFGYNTDEGQGWGIHLADPLVNVSLPGATLENVYYFLRGQYPTLGKAAFEDIVTLYSAEGDELEDVKVSMYGEVRFICTALFLNALASEYGQIKTFSYQYDNPSEETGWTRHQAELKAYFDAKYKGPGHDTLFPQMRRYLTSFVTDGEPAGPEHNWEPFASREGGSHMVLTPDEPYMDGLDLELVERCKAWERLDEELER
ncbi:Alpha/Beta hydrolase protein [Flagelloscypha sp. PMI_526]|nr:Alpha/Beta hydrolase protein [Flagelloscypha sp. PMI_526]